MKSNIVILGSGISGIGAAILASKQNYNVLVSDSKSIKSETKRILIQKNISWEENGHTELKIINSDLIVKSPGISSSIDIIKKITELKIPIISEIEFAFRYTKAKIIAVTGTNGRTTTTLLISKILKDAGFNVLTAGNIGVSFANEIAIRDYNFVVLEVSSFQLDDIIKFKPNVAVLLNITPDHLDRYSNDFSSYKASKLRITSNQNEQDYLIYNQDQLEFVDTKAKKLPISLNDKIDEGGFFHQNKINININNYKMTIQELALQGKHNTFNSMAAAMVARVFDVSDTIIRQSLIDFENVEHRLEYVLTVNGVDFINDSKATNVNASWYALESMHKKCVWILGGVDKGNDYSEIKKIINNDNVRAIICLGENNAKIKSEFKNVISDIYESATMKEAVEMSYNISSSGDTVLLSPACASFDMYSNFEERGIEFKKQVRSL